ncbi:T9SS type A sorting domain-containing protein [Pontibacter sp. 172403-2]|uniref:T9SS type A sorting domain-containing protein n=1 Tax=Pontibacter rufus TaxID=2791028 RepID=UPI0018AFDEB9|nr:T9SS type A sorting domain-containing protein [Pontibacter sp. 172403-2]MBF9253052.1 T9SS type A sorting domain-containing protein [Pontibacter sp. 172403-2]
MAVFVVPGFGQSTIFKETMGTVTSPTVEEHELYNYFSNIDLTMTGIKIGDPAGYGPSISNVSPSSPAYYAGASGASYVQILPGTEFKIAGISTLNYTNLSLSFGIKKTQDASAGAELTIEYSADDGANWKTLVLPSLDKTSTNWEYKTLSAKPGEEIPAVSNLMLRFRNLDVGALQFRIDDIELVGEPAGLPAITITAALQNFNTAAGTASVAQAYTVSGVNLTEGITITAPANFQVATSTDGSSFADKVTIALTNEQDGSLAETTIYVRYLPAASGEHSGNIVHTSTGEIQNLAVLGSTSTYPVELTTFTAEQSNGATLLSWTTASEKNNAYFDVEMAPDQESSFRKIVTINSKVTSSALSTDYTYSHTYYGNSRVRYYRLKQVDLDGTYTYSKTIAVKAAALRPPFVRVAPNPLNYTSKVYLMAAGRGKAVVRLHGITGVQVYSKAAEVQAGQNEIQLPLYDKLQTGVYILTVELESARYQVKVVKQ